MSIKSIIAQIKDSKDFITELLVSEFNIDKSNSEFLFDRVLQPHFTNLRSDLYLFAETPYIDKVYRDSYYHYYSSKLKRYCRDTIRISFFEKEITLDDFRNENSVQTLEDSYLGFIILRPTEPQLIGRSLLSPRILLNNSFQICQTKYQTTVNSIKLNIEGFPHSSQDTETISCAETTLWAIMEYFSNKYPEYSPVLPSKIIKVLNQVSFERQIPSKGLNIQQMSFALKEFCFGTRIYSKTEYQAWFENLLSCYVESGIPVIVAIENRHAGGNIGHAKLCIGRNDLLNDAIDKLDEIRNLSPELELIIKHKSIRLYDYDDIDKKFIFIDDNQPAYQVAKLKNPAVHYVNADWHNCRITYFIVPLYPKIYLEAFEAKNFFLKFILQGPVPVKASSDVVLRCYLTSSRSFKDDIARNSTIVGDLKELILETSMPKFIWIAELSEKDLLKDKRTKGIVIIDATETNLFSYKPLILAAYDDVIITFDETAGNLVKYTLTLHNFKIFENNLKN